MDTIFAQCSKLGKSAISVFRISGPISLSILKKLTQSDDILLSNHVYCRNIYNFVNNELIDKVIVIYFKSPKSFTGEDAIEIHTHGSIVITKILYELLSQIPGLRMAEPGEFTKRALYNGKLDVTEVESLVDLINAETVMQHKQAITQHSLKSFYETIRAQLLMMISILEANIDFSDQDINNDSLQLFIGTKDNLIKNITQYLKYDNKYELLRDGITLSIIGKPNVGKSSLMNVLTTRDVSIISNIPGTTRDIITSHIDINGYPFILYDTAGVRNSTNEIEVQGIERAINIYNNSNIRIIMFDATASKSSVTRFLYKLDSQFKKNKKLRIENILFIFNKIDLLKQRMQLPTICKYNNTIEISLKHNINTSQITNAITQIATDIVGTIDNSHVYIRERHRCHLQQIINNLLNIDCNRDFVLNVEDIKYAINHLSQIVDTQTITINDVLNEIFANFCIGK